MGLIQYDRCPSWKISGHEYTEGDKVSTKGGDSHLQANRKGLRRNQHYGHLDLELLASGTLRK